MKKIILLSFITTVFFASNSYSQTKADLAGVWRATTQEGENPATVSYVLLNVDGTYSWGTDSTGQDPTGKALLGNWDLTLQKEIKILPLDKSAKIVYYAPMGSEGIYKYKFYDQAGQKTVDKNTGTSMFLQKLQ
jgi:hypothetical protein